MLGWKIYQFNNVKSYLLSAIMKLRIAEDNVVSHYSTPYQKVSVLCSDGIMYLSDALHLVRISWVAIWRVDQGGVRDGVTIVRQTVDDRLRLRHLCGHQQPQPGQQ